MVRLLQITLMTLALVACKHVCAAEPVTFRRPADDKNENSRVINSIALSPDGRLVAAAFGKWGSMFGEPVPGQAVLWDTRTGRRRAALLGHGDGVSSVAFSPNGKLIATTGLPAEIKLWRTETAKEIATIRTKGRITSIAFSPDDKFLAVGFDNFGTPQELVGNLELYDITTRKLVRRFEGHEWGILAVTFSPTGRLLATSGGDGVARLWDVTTGKLIAKLKDQKLSEVLNSYWRVVSPKRKITVEDLPPSIESVAFSPDGKRLAVAGGMMIARGREYGIGAVTIWDVATRKPQSTLPMYDICVKQVQFSVDGKRLATAGRGGCVRLWDASTLRELGRVPGLAPIAFPPDGKSLISSTRDPALQRRRLVDFTRQGLSRKTEKKTDKLVGLKLVWSVGHDYLRARYDAYLSPVYDPRSKVIFALHYGRQCDVLGLDGKVRRSFKVDAGVNTLRLARLSGADKSEFIGFVDPWGDSVTAFNSVGKVLWQQASDDGIDDVWTADLDGDGRDEVIVGYNGSGGLHVFNHAGVRQWKNKQLANVWHVTAGDVLGDKKKEVIATSNTGKVHILDANGKALKTLNVPFEAFMVRVVRLAKQDVSDTIVVAGSGKAGGSIAALDGNGKVLWKRIGLKTFESIDSMVVCPTRPWVAFCASERGDVTVLDCSDGKIIGNTGDQGSRPQLDWATADDSKTPILLVATVRALSAFQVKPRPSAPASKKAK